MMPKRADPARPRPADVADGYDLGADAYEALWSPVILPPAAALVRNLALTGRCVVADVGAGTGALLSVIRGARIARRHRMGPDPHRGRRATSPARRVDAGLDRPAAMEALLRPAGLRPDRIWTERLRHQWNRSSFWELASSWGANRARLSRLDATTRARVLARAHSRLGQLTPQDYLWEGEIICAVATRAPATAQNRTIRAQPCAQSMQLPAAHSRHRSVIDALKAA